MVSIHIVPVIVYLIIKVISSTFRFKRGTAMPRLQLKVLGKPARTDMVIAAHAYSVGTTMQTSCSLFENFLGFQQQESSITLL